MGRCFPGEICSTEAMSTISKQRQHQGKTLDQWFNTAVPFERVAANQPAAFHARVFPRNFNRLRADGLNQWNANIVREFRIAEGVGTRCERTRSICKIDRRWRVLI